MFVIFPNLIATPQVVEELLPQGRSYGKSRGRPQTSVKNRSEAIAKDSNSILMLLASISKTESCNTNPSVPRIYFKAPKPIPLELEAASTPLNWIANPMAQPILPTQRAIRYSDRTQNARTNPGTEEKASNYHGKTITKQCLPPPPQQSFWRRQSQ
jgi:hypothetical protein